MEIIMKNDMNKVLFGTLNIGDVFMYNNLVFMKTEISYNDVFRTINTVRLDGKITHFDDDTYVTPIDGKFIMD